MKSEMEKMGGEVGQLLSPSSVSMPNLCRKKKKVKIKAGGNLLTEAFLRKKKNRMLKPSRQGAYADAVHLWKLN